MKCNQHRARSVAIMWGALISLAPVFPVMAAPANITQPVSGDSAMSPVQVDLALTTEGRRLYANLVIKALSPAPRVAQKMIVQWMPPAHSYCTKSEYALFYCGKIFHTRSFRTIIHPTQDNKIKTCDGLWHVAVEDETGHTLAKSEIMIPGGGPGARE